MVSSTASSSPKKSSTVNDRSNIHDDHGQTTATRNKDSKKNKKKRRRGVPQPGDPAYKTPTQLRNARKRRNKQQQQSNSGILTGMIIEKKKVIDPSLQYLAHPTQAPMVQKARTFFQQQSPPQPFPIHVGPKEGWRTVAKLAVRRSSSQSIQLGLFAPHTHDVLPHIEKCQIHHSRINQALQVVQDIIASTSTKLQAYHEESGTGHWSYLLLQIQPSTGRQQITLVWKTASTTTSEKKSAAAAAALNDLCQRIIAASDDPNELRLDLHQLWIHYNSTWKHSNAIVEYSTMDGTAETDAKWERRYPPSTGSTVRDVTNNNEKDSSNASDRHDFLLEELDFSIHQDNSKKQTDKKKKEKKKNKRHRSNDRLRVPLYFPPQVFRQANLQAFTKIVTRIRQWIHQRDAIVHNVWELYGGVGTIGLSLIVDCISTELICSDANPYNEACFQKSANQLKQRYPSLLEKTIYYETKDATAMIQEAARSQSSPMSPSMLQSSARNVELMIVDPPRKGLDVDVLDALCCHRSTKSTQMIFPKLETLVYVSCGFAAFQRDCQQLTTRDGGWTLDHAEGYVLFPGSDHIETLAIFTRMKTI